MDGSPAQLKKCFIQWIQLTFIPVKIVDLSYFFIYYCPLHQLKNTMSKY